MSAPARAARPWRLPLRGADVTGVDASREMLAVARARAAEPALTAAFDVADAHALPLPDRSVDAAMCLARPDARRPTGGAASANSAASRGGASSSTFRPARASRRSRAQSRRARGPLGRRTTEPYRVLGERDVRAAFASSGFRVVACTASSCCRSPCTRPSNSLTVTTRRRAPAGARSACCACWDPRSRWWRSGEGARHGRDGVHRRPPGARARAPGDAVRALVRDPARAADLLGGRHRGRARATSPIARACARAVAGMDVVYNIAALYRTAGLPAGRLSRRERGRGGHARRGGRGRAASAASCTAARSACMATSSTRRRTKTRRSSRATSIRRPSWRARASAARPRRALGVELVIARPTGIYGPGDRRLLQAVRQRRAAALRHSRRRPDLLPSDLHRRSLRGLSPVRHGAGGGRPHVHPGRRRSDRR